MAPLTGTSPESLANEAFSHAAQWNFVHLAPKFATRPLLILTSNDGLSAPNDAFVAAVNRSGNHAVKAIHFPTDHTYSDHRIALQKAILDFLASLHRK
jgi:hypothetical protein